MANEIPAPTTAAIVEAEVDVFSELPTTSNTKPEKDCDNMLVESENAKTSQYNDDISDSIELPSNAADEMLSSAVSDIKTKAQGFLGFDEGTEEMKPKTTNQEVNTQPFEAIIKTATPEKNFEVLKSWLTTGKAIAPTRTKDTLLDKVKTSCVSNVPPKKRWELERKSQDDIEVTDDTSPVDDDDDTGCDLPTFRATLHTNVWPKTKRTPNRTENQISIIKKLKFTDDEETIVAEQRTTTQDTNKNVQTTQPTTVITSKKRKRASRAKVIESTDESSDCTNEVVRKKIGTAKKGAEVGSFALTDQPRSENVNNATDEIMHKCVDVSKTENPAQIAEEEKAQILHPTVEEIANANCDLNKSTKPNNSIALKKRLELAAIPKLEKEVKSKSDATSLFNTQTRNRLSLDITNNTFDDATSLIKTKKRNSSSRFSLDIRDNSCRDATSLYKIQRGSSSTRSLDIRDRVTAVRERKSIIEFSETHERRKTDSDSDNKTQDPKDNASMQAKLMPEVTEVTPANIVVPQLETAAAVTQCSNQINKRQTESTDTSKSVAKFKATETHEQTEASSEKNAKDASLSSLGIPEKSETKVLTEDRVNQAEVIGIVTPVSTKKRPGRKPKLKGKVETTTESQIEERALVVEQKDSRSKSKPEVEVVKSTLGELKSTRRKSSSLTSSIADIEDAVVTKKKPGRKPKSATGLNKSVAKNDSVELLSCINEIKSEETMDTTITETVTPPTPKRRGRKPKAVLETADSVAKASVATETPQTPLTPVTKKVGRKAKTLHEQFNSRLLLITKRSQLDTDEVLTMNKSTKTSKHIQCGFCLEFLAREKWTQHLSKHYGVGWIVDEMPPIDVNTRSVVLNTMVNFVKLLGGKVTLDCRMCQRSFRSGLGALQHIELCGAAPARVACQYCAREYTKFSLSVHERTCAVRATENVEEELAMKVLDDDNDSAQLEKVYNNVGRVKRVSVMKAEKLLKVIGNDLTGSDAMTQAKKNAIKFVPATAEADAVLQAKWSKDLEQQGTGICPAAKCTYESGDLQALNAHYKSCKLKAKGFYLCTLCKTLSKLYTNEADVFSHVQEVHKSVESTADFEPEDSDCGIKTDDESSGDDDDISSGVNSVDLADDDDFSAIFENVTKAKGPSSIRDVFPPRFQNLTANVNKLWHEFTSENYSQEPLFTEAKPAYTLQSIADFDKYLPRQKDSMKFFLQKKSNFFNNFGAAEQMNWSELQRFDSSSTRSDRFMFVGAPIKKCAWVPLPTNAAEQYLLVSYRLEYTRTLNPKITNAILLLYKVTSVVGQKHESTDTPPEMQLQYAINIPEGPVHCMSFLPSGGYNPDANRLALVAFGTASSVIKIYALPLTVQEEQQEDTTTQADKHLLLIEPKVVMVLALTLAEDLEDHPFVNTQCIDLCWSEAAKHLHIFAGYANGCISWWDIDETMNFLRAVVDDVPHFVPVHFFNTCEKRVNNIAVHYDTIGVRWLAFSSGPRDIYIYDILELNRPILMKTEHCKDIITSIDWSPVWESFIIGLGDTMSNLGHNVTAISPINLMYCRTKVDVALGEVTQVHYNPLLNVTAYATDNGDVVFLATREYYLDEILPKNSKNCKVVSMMDMKCLNGDAIPDYDLKKDLPPGWKNPAENCEEKYGLVFGAAVKFLPTNKNQYLNEKRKPPLNLYHCTRINAMRWNLNKKGKHFLAIGYENGFLRITNFRSKTFSD